MKLNTHNVSHMVCAKTFSENTMKINSIDYSADGMSMITSSDDDSIFIYNMQNGTRARNVSLSIVGR
uniref:WD_REPEATS_REGION domain-containing protein n=1 Tax=Heterorhabditis bacteriophora TaxID=37862 RepID=A0A1I7WYV3_HETBA